MSIPNDRGDSAGGDAARDGYRRRRPDETRGADPGGDGSMSGAGGSTASTVAVLGLVVLLAVGLGVGGVGAGDQVAVITPGESTVEAAPGETVELEVTMRSQGGHGGEGVGTVALVAEYDPDYVEITDLEAGPWLEGDDGGDVAVEETLDHEGGTATLEQTRTGGGATGNDVIATLTVAVAEDAAAGETTISFGESGVELERGWPVPIHDGDATVAIDDDGSGEGSSDDRSTEEGTSDEETADDWSASDQPADDEAATDEAGGGEGADDESDNDELADDRAENDDTDALPGFAAAVAVVAIGVALLALAGVRRRSR